MSDFWFWMSLISILLVGIQIGMRFGNSDVFKVLIFIMIVVWFVIVLIIHVKRG